MVEFFKYFSIFLFAASILYIIFNFFNDSKLTDFFLKTIKKNNKDIKKDSDLTTKAPKTNVIFDDIKSIYSDIRKALNKGLSDNVKLFLIIAFVAVATRILIYIFGYYAGMLDRGEGMAFKDIWVRWDAIHYLNIAKNWYIAGREETEILIVFYPLYPIFIKILNVFVGNAVTASIILSNLFLAVGCFYMYKLFEFEFDTKTAWNGVKYYLIFPVSFFLCIPYTESLFIMLSVMMFYYLRKEKWLVAGFIGMFACLSRFHGILLFIPFVIEIFLQKRIFENIIDKKHKIAFKDLLSKGAISLLVPLGFGLYLTLNKVVTGSWFKFLFWQENHWRNTFKIFYDGSVPSVASYFINSKPNTEVASLWIPQFFAIVLAFLVIIYAMKMKMRVSYFAYMAAYLFLSISQSWLISAPRYIMAAFPIYLVAARLARRKGVDIVLTVASLLALMYCIFAFVNGKFMV